MVVRLSEPLTDLSKALPIPRKKPVLLSIFPGKFSRWQAEGQHGYAGGSD